MIFNINSTRGQTRFLTCVARVTCLVINEVRNSVQCSTKTCAQLRCFENGNDDFGVEAFWRGDAARVGYFVPLNGPFLKTGTRLVFLYIYSACIQSVGPVKALYTFLPWQTCSSRHQLCFSWKHSSHAAIARRLFTHISTNVYSQVLIYRNYTAESRGASWREPNFPNFETVAKWDSNQGSLNCECGILPLSYHTPL